MSTIDQIRWWTAAGLAEEADKQLLRISSRLNRLAQEATDGEQFLRQALEEVAAETSAQWSAVLRRTPKWVTLAEIGRQPFKLLPFEMMEEALDRNAGGLQPLNEKPGWSLACMSLNSTSAPGAVLLVAGQSFTANDLPVTMLLSGEALGAALDVVGDREQLLQRNRRLKSTLEIASAISGVRESRALLERIAEESTRLLECDRASIFVWDREHKEVVACPALGVAGGTLRLPDDTGIVGDVIHRRKPARVDDAATDDRIDRGVDQQSGYETRNLLCWPLQDDDGEMIGAFEVLNKHENAFTADDEECLALLSRQAAIAIRNTREREQLIRSRDQLTQQVTQGVQIIGESAAVEALRDTIGRLAATDLPVLILGESGTGKEVVAQALHYQGPRADHPFVAVNCAALTETLLESELFGHEQGAFTDARETRQGKFELAEGGTLFLDEIGDMSQGGQAKLLRVLEQKVITRVGGSQPIPINVRIIAATNADLPELVREKKFREDLFYRLSVVTQQLPPLRERPDDVLPLAHHFLGQFCRQARRPTLKLSADARKKLQAHHWPGNVRELRNLMERIAFLSPADRIEADDLAFILGPQRGTMIEPSADMGLNEATRQFQQQFIRRSIKRVQNNMSEAARLLGLHRSNLYRKMRQLEMKEVGGEE